MAAVASTKIAAGNADRPCASESRRHRARARLSIAACSVSNSRTLRAAGGLHLGRRLSSSHRTQYVGECGRIAAAARHDGSLSSRHSLSRTRRSGASAEAAHRSTTFRSMAHPITASAKRSICAIPTRTASSFIGTGRRRNGRAIPMDRSACIRAGSISTTCSRRTRKRARSLTFQRPNWKLPLLKREGSFMASYLLAIDQGTTSTRSILFRADLTIAASAQQEFPQHFPTSGWVEHEPEDLWRTTRRDDQGRARQSLGRSRATSPPSASPISAKRRSCGTARRARPSTRHRLAGPAHRRSLRER